MRSAEDTPDQRSSDVRDSTRLHPVVSRWPWPAVDPAYDGTDEGNFNTLADPAVTST
jgi:hypothetical protein